MRVNQSGNNPVANTEVKGAKKSNGAEAAAQTEAAKKIAKPSAPIAGSVNAEISVKGKELAQAKAAATAAPDVREQKIAELKRRISTGEYNVSPEKIADRMVEDHLKSGIG